MPSSEVHPSTFENLPSEMMLEILGSLTDIRSLIAITCSCTKIYKTSTEAQPTIVPRVLSRELGNEILPEAIAVLQSSKSTWTKSTAQKFLSETLNERKIPNHNWSIADGVAVSRLYHQITQLATNFSSEASSVVGTTVSKIELNRFQRAFYRFEMYYNIFGGPNNPLMSVEEQRDAFFSNFSPWENEQLACVHDYLYRLLIPGKYMLTLRGNVKAITDSLRFQRPC